MSAKPSRLNLYAAVSLLAGLAVAYFVVHLPVEEHDDFPRFYGVRVDWARPLVYPILYVGHVRITGFDFLLVATLALPLVWIVRAAHWLVVRRRYDVRTRSGLCGRCGYDVRASEGRCSECGRPLSEHPPWFGGSSPLPSVRRMVWFAVLIAILVLTVAVTAEEHLTLDMVEEELLRFARDMLVFFFGS